MKYRMRNMVITAVFLSVSIALTACSGGGAQSAPSSSAPAPAVSSSEGQVSMSISPDGSSGLIVKGDASLQFGEDMKWPSDKLPKIAQPKAKITAVLSDSGQCSVALAELESEDAQSLLKSIKELGYTAAADVSDKDGYMYMGTASDGSSLTFTYNIADKEGLVIYVTAAASGNLPGGVTLPDITQSLPNVPGY